MIETGVIKKSAAILALFAVTAVALNRILLELFDQNSSDRAEHSLVGIVFLMGFFAAFSTKDSSRLKLKTLSLFFLGLVPCYFGTVFPDLDIKLLPPHDPCLCHATHV